MKIITPSDHDFEDVLGRIRNRGNALAASVLPVVQDIIQQIRRDGDRALRRLTETFDGHRTITVSGREMREARGRISQSVYEALVFAHRRITAFHRKQLHTSWLFTGAHGETTGQMVRPLERVGIYVPGGKAVYPSSVLMNALPARVAGVREIVMVTPGGPEGIAPEILVAASLCGIRKVYRIGGAQAIAALAYGTKTVPRVDKIVGPGNIYVATAKKLVFGDVAIDMIAGPSEILVVSDGSGDPGWAAADMLSQAEHDETASAVLITTRKAFAREVSRALSRQLARLPKREIARRALDRYGAIVVVRDLNEALRLADIIAPEHLELFVKDPWQLVSRVHNAGAVFVGHTTPEAVGDYVAGPNHVLPTGGTARFSSPLSVDDFLKKTSIIACPPDAFAAVAGQAAVLARAEGLNAHAASIDVRLGAAGMRGRKRSTVQQSRT